MRKSFFTQLTEVRLQLFPMVASLILLSGHLQGQLLINEIMASNAKVHADTDYGNYCDWIEIVNVTSAGIDISGCYLSDDPDNPAMWSFPAGTLIGPGEYMLVYADGSGNGLHTNFKLAKEGEKILLLNHQLVILDSVTYTYQLTDVSYGRHPVHSGEFNFFQIPTPGFPNNTPAVSGMAPFPHFSHSSGFYTGTQWVEIRSPDQAGDIYYTLDGTEPTLSSQKYTNPLQIETTTVIRAKAFEDGKLSPPVQTLSCFIDEPQNLPVISLVTDPAHLFSDETGIYVIGTHGVTGYCTSVPHNVNQDWERPVNVELIEKDGVVGLNQQAGVKIFGGCSRTRYPMKSLGLYARKEYETSSFKYPLFPDMESVEYETFILRTSADDQPFTLFKDALAQMVVKDVIDVDVQAYRPVVVYINGEYWGIHNLREKINEHYPNDHFGVNPDSVDMVKRDPGQSWNLVHGSADHYNAMIQYLRDHDITQKMHYEYIKDQIDIEEYLNYQVIQIFLGARDWPGNNIKFWRSSEEPYDKWRWVLYDMDHTFTEFFSDIMEEAAEEDCGCTWPNPPWSTYLFRRLLENETFRHEFIQRFTLFSSTHFSRERVHGIIDEMQAVLAPEIPRHIARWGGQKTNLPDNSWVSPIFSSVEQWEGNVQRMRDFTDTRHEMAIKQMQDYFGISGLVGLSVKAVPGHAGEVRVGNTILPNSIFSGEISRGESLRITAITGEGYIFSHWEVDSREERDSILITKGDAWKYLESWGTPAGDWTSPEYNDGTWKTGIAELGYGDGDEATVISFGGDPQNKMITSWFRKRFSIETKNVFTRYTIRLLRDDGARVYLNGKEVVRDNMDRWSVGSGSPALIGVEGEAEKYYHTFHLNPGLFVEGENVIAVEIHQSSATSSDISFDMELSATVLSGPTEDRSEEEAIEFSILEHTSLTAYFISDTLIVTDVFINEIMASNRDKYPDEAGDYEDWIELYNAGTEAVDVAGLFLSDHYPDTGPWQIPEGFPELTTIDPAGFLVIFADKEPEEGVLHANFRLSADGELIVLMQRVGDDTLMVDSLHFGPQYGNVSWGRYPDGSANWEFMPTITPGYANYVQPLDTTFVKSTVVGAEINVYPVPTNGRLFVTFSNEFIHSDFQAELFVYSMSGRLANYHRSTTSGIIELNLEDHPKGVYLLKVITGNRVFERKVLLY